MTPEEKSAAQVMIGFSTWLALLVGGYLLGGCRGSLYALEGLLVCIVALTVFAYVRTK